MVIAAVERRPHQIVKTGIHQHKVTAAHRFHRPHLRDQYARLGDQKTTRFDFQLHRMAEMCRHAIARGVPQAIIVFGINRLFAIMVRNGEPATRGDRFGIGPAGDNHIHHRIAHLLKMGVIHAGADMHMNPCQMQAVALHRRQSFRQIAVPDAVLTVFAAGVGFLAVAVTKTRIYPQPDRMTSRSRTQLMQHVDRSGIHRHLQFNNARQRGVIQQVSGKNDLIAARLKTGSQRPFNFTQRNGIDLDARFTHQTQNMNIGAGFLGKTHGIKLL